MVTIFIQGLRKHYFAQEVCIMFRGENELGFELQL